MVLIVFKRDPRPSDFFKMWHHNNRLSTVAHRVTPNVHCAAQNVYKH